MQSRIIRLGRHLLGETYLMGTLRDLLIVEGYVPFDRCGRARAFMGAPAADPWGMTLTYTQGYDPLVRLVDRPTPITLSGDLDDDDRETSRAASVGLPLPVF